MLSKILIGSIISKEMIRSLKLFAACVESMRMAEKDYFANKTASSKRIMLDLQNKVDGWIKWIHSQEDAQLVKNVPPFIQTSSIGIRNAPSNDAMKRLMENHTLEEIERFTRLVRGEE